MIDNDKNNFQEDNKNDLDFDDQKIDNQPPKLVPRITPVRAALLGLLGGFVLYQFVGGSISLLIFGLDISNANINALRLMTIGGQILFILLPALIFAKFIYEDVTTVIRFRKTSFTELGLFTFGLFLLNPMLQSFLVVQNFYIDQLANYVPFLKSIKEFFDSLSSMLQETYVSLLTAKNFFEVIIVITAVAITPAICEEVMFRGYVQKSFELKFKPFLAAVITSLFFAVFHFNPYGIIALFALSLYFGYSVYKSDSIIVPVILHFLNNFIAIIYFMIVGPASLDDGRVATQTEVNFALMTFLLLSLLFAVLIVYIHRFYKLKELEKNKKAELSNG